MRVAIIGAGIGGLATACGLQRHGADVVVLERSDAPPASGSGLSMFGNGFRALDSLGVGEQVRTIAGARVAELRGGQRRPDGRWLKTTSPDVTRDLRIVHRRDLQQTLLDALRPGTVRFGANVTALGGDRFGHATRSTGAGTDGRPAGAEGRVALEVDGRTPWGAFDLVVAADGIRSRVRASWGDDPGTRYSGYSAWRGVTTSAVDVLGAAGETWGRGRRFGYAPLRDGRIYWFAVSTMPEDATVDDEHGAVRALTAGWHDPISAIVEATDPDTVFRLPIRDLAAPLPSFRRGRCVLLGDAAHAMTPDLGQGGNQAMEDAAVLTALLAPLCRESDPPYARLEAALAEYDRLRRRRTQPVARRARMLGKLAQASGTLSVPVRDVLMRAIPAASLDRQALALQQWHPPTPEQIIRLE
jgi:2-polyprenyl-6-methoxyphenol hydroxylase-like FAD-dependent oxidoreductase